MYVLHNLKKIMQVVVTQYVCFCSKSWLRGSRSCLYATILLLTVLIACEGGSAVRLGHFLMTCETSRFKLFSFCKLLYYYG